MKEKLISIITPCYNSEKTIEKTIESVLKQEYKNFEYIIIDGESTDRTLEIISRYQKIYPGKIKVISEKDSGIYDAMNKGIDIAKGDIIGIINSDDYYEMDSLNMINNIFDERKLQIIYGMLRIIDEEGDEVLVGINNHNFLEENMIYHPAIFVNSKIYKEISRYSLKYKYVSDYDFMLRMKLNEKVEFKPIYEIISNFRRGGVTSTVGSYLERLDVQRIYGILSKKQYYLKKIITYGKQFLKVK